jgi:hypothetical protein
VGFLYFHGKNAEDKDCIYIKMRRSSQYSGIDLRTTECHLRTIFEDKYMGGGGHAGAVSFRVHLHDENQFLTNFEQVVTTFDGFNADPILHPAEFFILIFPLSLLERG